jgi:hypothetical protein
MVDVQMLLLPAQCRNFCCFSISLPDQVLPLRFMRCSSIAQVVLPDREPFFEEGARHTKLTADGSGQQVGQLLTFFFGEVLGLMKE